MDDQTIEGTTTAGGGQIRWEAHRQEGPQPLAPVPNRHIVNEDELMAAASIGDAGTPITADGTLAEGEEDGLIPPSPLWPMKMRRHFQWSHLMPHDEQAERLRLKVGEGDDAVYVIDDGHHHCIVGRDVGTTPEGCHYSLLSRLGRNQLADLQAGRLSASAALLAGRGLSLYGVIDDGPASMVFLVGSYASPNDVPSDFLPPSPPIAFSEDLDEF
jgi:hypothetical protein